MTDRLESIHTCAHARTYARIGTLPGIDSSSVKSANIRQEGETVAERKWAITAGDWVEYVTSRGNVARRPALVRNERWKPKEVRLIDTKPKDVVELWLRQGGYCGLCWEPLSWPGLEPEGHPDEPTIDHIVPQSWGGDDCLMNTQAAHRRCNSAKGNRSSDVSWLHDDFPGRKDVESPRTAFDEETMWEVRDRWLYWRSLDRESR